MTNGVSFSLVDGAVCGIVFTNNPYTGGNGGTLKSVAFSSLNINSTGAKTVGHSYYLSAQTSGYFYSAYPATGNVYFVVYGNSKYTCISPLYFYNDYADW